MSANLAIGTEHIEQRNEHDHTDKRADRRYMAVYDSRPAGALTWRPSDTSAKAKVIRAWRRASWWKAADSAIACRLVTVLGDYTTDDGYAYPGNERLGADCFASPYRIDKLLTRLERVHSIIRVYENETGRRRIYPATAIILEFAEFESEGSS
jgi:hypothetical protein